MKIVRLENGKLVLAPSKQKEDFQIKFELHENTTKEINVPISDTKEYKAKYAYVDWEVSERKSNITEFLQCIRDCCKYNFYTEQDILDYQNFIEQQDDLKTDPNKTYYDSRAAIDEIDKNFTSSSLMPCDTFDIQQVSQNRNIPFWIEIHVSETNGLSLHICFYTLISKPSIITPYLPKNEDEPFELNNNNNKYMLLEACRVFAALGEYKESIQNKLKFCLDLIKIAKTFGLNPDEYVLEYTIGQNKSYSIYPIDRSDGEVIVKNFPEDLKIFNDYEFTFERCIFMLEKENKKDLQMGLTNDTVKNPITFDTCTFKGDISFCGIIFGEEVCFKNSTFECPVSFISIQFKNAVDFSQTNFKEKVSFSKSNFENLANFSDSNFKDEAFFKDSIFQHVSFKNAVFHSRANFNNTKFQTGDDSQGIADFSGSRFKERALFTESIFHKKANFSNVTFDHNAYFDEANFKKEAYFSQAEFYKNAHFYGTNFEDFPNFIQVIFNENVNFINTKSNVKFEKAKEQIETLYIEKKAEYDKQTEDDKKDKEEPKEHKIANEFRDSFRTIKSALIKDNNMLDASNYHRVELYCKELELEHKRKEKAKGFWENLKFLLNNGKDFVDEIQLYCYRITSDHHTNLLMILNNVIFLIALFGIMKCFLKHNYMSEALACIVFVIISISFLLCHKLTLEETCNKYSKIVNNNFVFILLYVIPAILLGYILFNYYASSACLSCVIFAIFILYAIFYNTIIEVITLAFAYLVSKKRNCILFLAYGMTTYMTFTTPTSILPILGKLIENKSGEACLLVIGKVKILCCSSAPSTPETLNLIYMLFLFLLLWSLQKTARKNTIVPN